MAVAFNSCSAGLEALLSSERTRLLRLCVRLTGDVQAAEDLAQETLLVAWQNIHQLRDPERCTQWLSGIARNLCRKWVRSRQRENALLEAPDNDLNLLSAQDRFVNAVDIELELERRALVELLDRALALLPPETRAALIQRYVEDSPYTEIAARLGLSEDAVAMRISRGKLALRRMLTTELIEEAVAFGLIDPSIAAWQETRIWCPLCGSQQLQGQLDPAAGVLRLRCARCNPAASPLVSSGPSEPLPVKTYKPAFTRLLAWIHDYYQVRAREGSVRCLYCSHLLPLRFGTVPSGFRIGQPPRPLAIPHGIYAWCKRCEVAAGVEEWWSLTLSLPDVREFWHQHPRVRALPERELEHNGCSAIVTGFESVSTNARIEVIFSQDTFAVLGIHATSRG